MFLNNSVFPVLTALSPNANKQVQGKVLLAPGVKEHQKPQQNTRQTPHKLQESQPIFDHSNNSGDHQTLIQGQANQLVNCQTDLP